MDGATAQDARVGPHDESLEGAVGAIGVLSLEWTTIPLNDSPTAPPTAPTPLADANGRERSRRPAFDRGNLVASAPLDRPGSPGNGESEEADNTSAADSSSGDSQPRSLAARPRSAPGLYRRALVDAGLRPPPTPIAALRQVRTELGRGALSSLVRQARSLRRLRSALKLQDRAICMGMGMGARRRGAPSRQPGISKRGRPEARARAHRKTPTEGGGARRSAHEPEGLAGLLARAVIG
jgi:hypothetical protein